MKKYLILFLLFTSCLQSATVEDATPQRIEIKIDTIYVYKVKGDIDNEMQSHHSDIRLKKGDKVEKPR
jgi:hypothetical protein